MLSHLILRLKKRKVTLSQNMFTFIKSDHSDKYSYSHTTIPTLTSGASKHIRPSMPATFSTLLLACKNADPPASAAALPLLEEVEAQGHAVTREVLKMTTEYEPPQTLIHTYTLTHVCIPTRFCSAVSFGDRRMPRGWPLAARPSGSTVSSNLMDLLLKLMPLLHLASSAATWPHPAPPGPTRPHLAPPVGVQPNVTSRLGAHDAHVRGYPLCQSFIHVRLESVARYAISDAMRS